MTSTRQVEIETSIVEKVQNAIQARGVLRQNHKLVAAVNNGDAPEAVHELKAMMPNLMTERFRHRFISPLSPRSHDPLESAAGETLLEVNDEFEELLDVMSA
ncbi:hypothetical protein HY312_04200 [Candidatus Saccharibacteria bacterium]|nr:hypothetical protein [Candidatus Saccharibacteria bacterium]